MVAVAARAPRVTGRRSRSVTLGLLGLLGFALVLEVAPRIGVVPIDYAPPTSQILVTPYALWVNARALRVSILRPVTGGFVLRSTP